MKLSVAMCTYNGARYLPEQLASLAAQTRPPDELVVCDDGSTDATRAILEEFKAQAVFPVRLHCNEENLGVVRNFSKAINLCEGDVIALCDQDDVWLPEKLSRFEAEFARAPEVGMVFSDLEVVDEDLRPLGFRAWQTHLVEFGEREQRLFARGKALDVLLTRNVVTGAAMAFRAKYKDLVLPIPELEQFLLHDHWIAMLIAPVAELSYIETLLVKYRTHAGQAVSLIRPDRAEPEPGKRKFWLPDPCIEVLLDRFSERDRQRYGAAIANLKGRIRHRRVCEQLPDYKLARRVLKVFGELLAGRYHLCAQPDSNGWRDAMNDLVPYNLRPDLEQ